MPLIESNINVINYINKTQFLFRIEIGMEYYKYGEFKIL